ncbi:MAG: nucleoside triphosphate pyrophosphatase [Jatrophihabitans sp.]|uniref:nucleoside triphosphate pyrophosphatase n=1 Tax=Jatrophihabitans sp. TaxID=1932789 RepID=UPI003F7E8263
MLASQSRGRYETLRRAGVAPEQVVSGVDEDAITAASVADLTQALAAAKARAVAGRLDGAALVLGCDSLLELDGEALGKPVTPDVAAERWRRMRGRTGTLWTGHCLVDTASGREVATAAATEVRFADLSDAEIELYVGTGEPLGVAGAFTLDSLGGWFVEGIDGDAHNVVGVSLPLLRRLLADLGHTLETIGYAAK